MERKEYFGRKDIQLILVVTHPLMFLLNMSKTKQVASLSPIEGHRLARRVHVPRPSAGTIAPRTPRGLVILLPLGLLLRVQIVLLSEQTRLG